jgi:acylphosphatase
LHQTEQQRADYRVTGRVQGVGYRWWLIRKAQQLGLRGTVRNLPDGSVEVRAAGTTDALRELASALLQGPPYARVQCVEPIPPSGPLPAEFRAER